MYTINSPVTVTKKYVKIASKIAVRKKIFEILLKLNLTEKEYFFDKKIQKNL